MNGGYELFRIGGVSVRLHGSLLILGIFLAVLSVGAGGTPAEVGLRLLNPLLLVITVILHELGHALVARRLGVTVIDVVLGPMGGMARLLGELREPKVEGLIALAGPTTNLVLAAGTLGLMTMLGRSDEIVWREIVLFLEDESFMQQGPLLVFFGLNILLGIVNLVPAFPSDGGRILRAILTVKLGRLVATRIAARIGVYFAIFLICLPFFATAKQWWITPFIGLYLMAACLKERFLVEAREGLGLNLGNFGFKVFRGGQAGGPFGPLGSFGSNDAEPEPTPHEDRFDRSVEDQSVIDVSATSRLVEDEDEDEK